MARPFLVMAMTLPAMFLAGCASLPPEASGPLERRTEEGRACVEWFAALDAAVDAAGARDAGTYRIPGFPYLRVDRFHASFRTVATQGGAASDTWVARLRALDLDSRQVELRNLPGAALLGIALNAQAALERVAHCGTVIAKEDLSREDRRADLQTRAVVPDDYAAWARNSGIYAIASHPFAQGVEDWHAEVRAMFGKSAGEVPSGRLRRYDLAGDTVSGAQVREILARASRDALGIPRITGPDLDALFQAHAPRYEIETTGAQDRFGPLAWKSGATPEVDVRQPAVYRRLAYTRMGERVLVQLVYTIWFPERPADHSFDILAGKLDGVVMRVTLDDEGAPLVWDTMHPCGCYHLFFPTGRVRPLPAPEPKEEWAFVPSTLPVLAPGQRIAVRTATRTHYVVQVRPLEAAEPVAETYAFADEDQLRALPLPQGGTRSIYGPDGLVRGSERRERLLFWPMGIASPGAMRQWGRHATAFVGRRHFDEADLIQRRFAPIQP